MSKEDGGPAFPQMQPDCVNQDGMSLRDWFAGMALQALMKDAMVHPADENPFQRYAGWAYIAADAMLTKRENNNGD